tara:strand:- start:32 stop:364 length:333 start_codon:yes stop_codon:yes gene_type:complete
MKASHIGNIKKKLELEIKNTKKKIDEYTLLCKPIAPENAIGRISRMDAINNKSVTEAVLRDAKIKLKQLNHIKSKINLPDFGKCFKCKQQIPLGRLLIRPESIHCVKCAY